MAWQSVIAIVVGLLALISAAIWKLGAASQRPRRLPNEKRPEYPYEEADFRSGGSTIRAWLAIPPDNERSAAVVIAHGWGSNRSRVLRYARPIYDSGIAVMLFDARSHGDSDSIKAPSGVMFREDVEAAVAFLKRDPRIDSDKIAVLGHSLGGYGALLALDRGLPVKAIVTDSAPLRLETMLKAELNRRKLPFFPLGNLIGFIWLLRAGISTDEMRRADIETILVRNFRQGQVPVLMVHSVRDGFIPADDLKELLSRVPVEHLLVQSEGHSVSERDPAFWDRVLPFLAKHLA